jgi:UDP:flavonoid glycosyltransferase YjiC (YdhE family)
VGELGLDFIATSQDSIVASGPNGATGASGVAAAARALVPELRDLRPDFVIADIATHPPALAAEVAGVRRATLVPILYPPPAAGQPVYESGFAPPRTPLGALAWRALGPWLAERMPSRRWVRDGSGWLNAVRREAGLARLERDDGAITEGLTLVATLPQLEYPRRWPRDVHVTGPMVFDPPHPDVELPTGEDPLVVIAASTERDPGLRLVKVALDALSEEPVRVVAATGRVGRRWPREAPGNATVAGWISYRQVLPAASVVVGQGGQGTLTRALSEGVPVLVCPDAPDMKGNGTRVLYAGAGLMLPRRLLAPGPLRWAVRRTLAKPRFAERAREIAAWARDNDGAARGAELVERYALR